MNNRTTEEIIIKHRGDGVYDIYLNDTWVCSRGHYINVLEEIQNLIRQIDA
jgi:hypothetical protein